MTHVLALWLGLAAGAGITYAAHLRWAEAHHYRQHRNTAFRFDVTARDADHGRRLSTRLQSALDALEQIHRDVVGHLLDEVADRERTIAQLTRPRHARHSPIPPYGRSAA